MQRTGPGYIPTVTLCCLSVRGFDPLFPHFLYYQLNAYTPPQKKRLDRASSPLYLTILNIFQLSPFT